MVGLIGLPVETLNQVAGSLPTKDDILNMAMTCRHISKVIFHPRATCWRYAFTNIYDLPPCKAVPTIRAKFIQRDLLRYRLVFKLGNGVCARGRINKDEDRATKLIRDIIIESYCSASKAKPTSRNLAVLRRIALSTNICEVNNYWNRGMGPPSRLLQAIHLMLLVPQLEQARNKAGSSTPGDLFPISQKAIYSHPDRAVGLFIGQDKLTVNLELVGHLSNFFKYHATCYEEAHLYDIFQTLGQHEKPTMWDNQILQGPQKLQRHWKGFFAGLESKQVDMLRSFKDPLNLFAEDNLFLDKGLIDLQLDFGRPKLMDGAWPRDWEDVLQSTPSVRLVEVLKQWPTDWIKSQEDPREFTNDVTAEYLKERGGMPYKWHRFVAAHKPDPAIPEKWNELQLGFIEAQTAIEHSRLDNPLRMSPTCTKAKKRPAPLQSTVEAGKHYHHFTGNGIDEGEKFKIRGNLHAVAPVEDIPGWQRISFMKWFTDGANDEQLCCEGVVLPGNKIILGRWWILGDDEYKLAVGPFVLWNVEHKS